MMRRVAGVIRAVDVRGVDSDEAHTPVDEDPRRGLRHAGILEEVGRRAAMSFPPAGSKEDRIPLPHVIPQVATRGSKMLGPDQPSCPEATEVEDVAGSDEPIDGHLIERPAARLEMERCVDMGPRMGDHEHRFRKEAVDLPGRPLGERRRRVRREHWGLGADRLGEVDDAGEAGRPISRGDGPTGRVTVAGELSGFLGTESFSGDPIQENAMPSDDLERLTSQIITCRKCPRLVRYRESVARTKRAAFRDWEYWGRPVPGWGDPAARLLVVGLAPAAHRGNRTGRVFTGDRSGDWLYRALHRAGFANRPTAISRDDGLELRDCYIVAAIRCAPPANKPTRAEFARCQPYLEREAMLLPNLRVVVALGGVAMARFLSAWRGTRQAAATPSPKVRPRASYSLPFHTLISSYRSSQRNHPTG